MSEVETGQMEHTGDLTLDLLKSHEGFVSKIYQDAVGYNTVGYGHYLKSESERQKYKGRELSEKEATELLKHDVEIHQKAALKSLQVDITEGQKVALTSLAFNAGPKAAQNIVDRMNKGKVQEAADAFLLYNKAGKGDKKRVLKGLTRRRKVERALFLSDEEGQALYDKFMDGVPDNSGISVATNESVSDIEDVPKKADMSKLMNINKEYLSRMNSLAKSLGAANAYEEAESRFLRRLRREGSGV